MVYKIWSFDGDEKVAPLYVFECIPDLVKNSATFCYN